MDDLYQQELLELYHKPHNFGVVANPTCETSESNSACGDSLKLSLKIEQGIVRDAKFIGQGCAVSMAAASLLTDYILNKSIADLRQIDFEFMQNLLGAKVSPGRVKCLTLGARALMNLLNQALVQHA